jgi:hypothetical protein
MEISFSSVDIEQWFTMLEILILNPFWNIAFFGNKIITFPEN